MFEMIEGDLEPDMPLTVTVEGTAQDLTAATTIELYWVKPDGTMDTVELTEVDYELGQVKRVWEAGDSDVVGYHKARIKVTWSTGEVQHYPNDGSWVWWSVYEGDE